jgi:hypothetical protein
VCTPFYRRTPARCASAGVLFYVGGRAVLTDGQKSARFCALDASTKWGWARRGARVCSLPRTAPASQLVGLAPLSAGQSTPREPAALGRQASSVACSSAIAARTRPVTSGNCKTRWASGLVSASPDYCQLGDGGRIAGLHSTQHKVVLCLNGEDRDLKSAVIEFDLKPMATPLHLV